MKFAKGQSGNPVGRPKGSKHKLTEAFWSDFAGAWETHGIQALQHVAENDPSTFVRVAANLMPKDIQVEIERRFVVHAPEPLATEEWELQRPSAMREGRVAESGAMPWEQRRRQKKAPVLCAPGLSRAFYFCKGAPGIGR